MSSACLRPLVCLANVNGNTFCISRKLRPPCHGGITTPRGGQFEVGQQVLLPGANLSPDAEEQVWAGT